MYKKLEVGDIHHLNLRVLNENGTEVQNREKPMISGDPRKCLSL